MEALSYISEAILLLSIFVHLFYLFKKGEHYKVFSAYLIFIFILDVCFHVLRNMFIANIFLTHYYFTGQALLLSVFYYKLLLSPKLRQTQLVLDVVLGIVLLGNMLMSNYHYHAFDHIEVVVANVIVVINMLLYMYERIEQHKVYYISTAALLVYTIASVIVFLSGNLLISMNMPEYSSYVWIVNIMLFLLLQTAILYDSISMVRKHNYG